MRRNRVPYYSIATQCRTRLITHHAFEGPKQEILRHFELAPPFWPLTVNRDSAPLAGYGVNQEAVCIRYKQHIPTINGRCDDNAVERTDFAPGCLEVMRRADLNNPAFVCEHLSPTDAIEIVSQYLIDAAISLTEGRGPLVVEVPNDPVRLSPN